MQKASQRHESAQQHGDAAKEAEHEYGLGILADKADVGLAIEIVGNDGAVGKEEDGCRKEPTAPWSQEVFQCTASQDDAVLAIGIQTAEDDDKGGTGTDDKRIGEDAQCLQHALLYRV